MKCVKNVLDKRDRQYLLYERKGTCIIINNQQQSSQVLSFKNLIHPTNLKNK